ncbi:MAG: succinylglutamate desuccinylase/aspartoacylase family protein [Caldilineaceae bacterium]
MTSSTEFTWLPVTTMADGTELRLPLHVMHGKHSGPTLGLTALVHGDEAMPSIAIIRRLFEQLNPEELSGTIMAVPVCNPPAAGADTRNTPHDGVNLNDAFGEPGEDSTTIPTPTISGQIAGVLKEGFLKHLDYHIDFHTGDDAMSVNMIEFSEDEESIAMARAFNMPVLLKDAWGDRQIWGASARAGAKVIVAEVGGGSMLFDQWLARGVEGTLNVMRGFGMIPGEVVPPPQQIVVNNSKGHHRNLVLLRSSAGGLLMPEPDITPQTSFEGKPLAGRRTLGKLINMYDLSVLETYETPFTNTVLLATAVNPSWHAPGDTLYIIADADLAETWD